MNVMIRREVMDWFNHMVLSQPDLIWLLPCWAPTLTAAEANAAPPIWSIWRHDSWLVAIDYTGHFSLDGQALLPHGIRHFFEVCIDLLCLQTSGTLSCGLEECHHILNKHALTKAHALHTYCNDRLALLGLSELNICHTMQISWLKHWRLISGSCYW